MGICLGGDLPHIDFLAVYKLFCYYLQHVKN